MLFAGFEKRPPLPDNPEKNIVSHRGAENTEKNINYLPLRGRQIISNQPSVCCKKAFTINLLLEEGRA